MFKYNYFLMKSTIQINGFVDLVELKEMYPKKKQWLIQKITLQA